MDSVEKLGSHLPLYCRRCQMTSTSAWIFLHFSSIVSFSVRNKLMKANSIHWTVLNCFKPRKSKDGEKNQLKSNKLKSQKLTSPDDSQADRIDRHSTAEIYPPVLISSSSPFEITAVSKRRTISIETQPFRGDFPVISISSFPWFGRFMVCSNCSHKFGFGSFFLFVRGFYFGLA